MRASAQPLCYACGGPGEPLHAGLRDAIAKAPGEWTLKRCRDPDCRLVWMDPMPLPEDIHVAYERYYTHRDPDDTPAAASSNVLRRVYARIEDDYVSQRYGYPSERSRLAATLSGSLAYLMPLHRPNMDFGVMCLRSRPFGTLLEIGCGSGAALRMMANRGWRVRGLDFDAQAVESARRKGLAVDLGDVRAQRYAAQSFDAITMNHVIEHAHDPRSLLRECHRLLAPGGALAIATPNPDGLGHRWFGRNWRGLETPRHLYLYPPRTLARLVAESSFEKLSWKSTIRGAQWSLADSVRIRARARGRDAPVSAPVAARVLQALEWAALAIDTHAGDETAILAFKG